MNWKELKAVHLSLMLFQEELEGSRVRVLSDSMTALSCLRKEGSLVSTALGDLTEEICLFLEESDISILPIHLKGKINVLADQGSRRGPIPTEWSLDDNSFLWCCQQLGVPQVDLFATRFNRKIPRYVSPCPDPEAVGWDSLERVTNWNQWRSIYLFPPLGILDKVVGLLNSYKGAGFLIAPFWPTRNWFPLLSMRCPIRFPLPKNMFLYQRLSDQVFFHNNLFHLNLHVWKL